MTKEKNIIPSRRDFLKGSLVLTAGGVVLSSCGGAGSGGLECATSSSISRSEMLSREGRGYAELSRVDGRNCLNCEFYSGTEENCGECLIDSLPANPLGHCVSWTAKQA